MLPTQSRVYNPKGGWSKEAIAYGNQIHHALKNIMDDNKDKFSPDKFETITMRELGMLVSETRLDDNVKRRKIEKQSLYQKTIRQ